MQKESEGERERERRKEKKEKPACPCSVRFFFKSLALIHTSSATWYVLIVITGVLQQDICRALSGI